MGTRVKLTRSGGFAGINLVASVDVDELPEPTAREILAALEQVDFTPRRGGAPGRRMPGAADIYQYDLVVTGGQRRAVTAHEPLSDPGLLALSEVLLPLARPE